MDNPIHVEVHFFASFRTLAGKNKLILEMVSGHTVQVAFFKIVSMLPVLKSHWLDQNNQPQIYVHIYLNQKDVSTLLQGMQSPLKDGDILDFIPPVAGG